MTDTIHAIIKDAHELAKADAAPDITRAGAETIADIIAEMRGIRIREFQDYADRFDAAHRREHGNAAKLREALVSVQKKIHYLIGSLNVPNSLVANRMEINGIINAALAAPVRNCDVGVPEERIQRWSKFCKARSKKLPPIHGFEWEDYPYEEGGDK